MKRFGLFLCKIDKKKKKRKWNKHENSTHVVNNWFQDSNKQFNLSSTHYMLKNIIKNVSCVLVFFFFFLIQCCQYYVIL